MKILLTVAYDGSLYCGWQIQKNGVSIQEKLEEGLTSLLQKEIRVTGASRTDSGVHAKGQRACFSVDTCAIPMEKLPYALNRCLPEDIIVNHAQYVNEDFHPQYDAKEKTYAYVIVNSPFPEPCLRRYCWHVKPELDVKAMEQSLKGFTGKHDYSAFCATGGQARTTVRQIYETQLKRQGQVLTFTVKGNGFLYNMVRIMTGTLVYVGLGKIQPGDIADIILSKDRTKAGITAPSQGLSLEEVVYEI